MSSKIVIVGAGYAGILTAKKLARKLKKVEDVSITIIDRNPYHVMLTELHEVAAGRVPEESIRADLKKIFAGRKVNVVLDTINDFDFDKQIAIGNAATYSYDYLVVSTGSKPTHWNIPGAEEHVLNLWSYDDAVKIKCHIESLFIQASRTPDPVERKELLNMYVVGAGFTGVEMAGELAEYMNVICRRFGIDRGDVSISIVDLLDRIVPVFPEKLSIKAEKRLNKMGVNVILNTGVCKVGPDFIDLKEGDQCIRHKTKTIIWSAGTVSSDLSERAAEDLESCNKNRIKTDPYLRSLTRENVFAIGDNLLYVPEGSETAVPQIVENCEQSAHIAAHNIAALVTGAGELEEYKPSYHGFMVCIGGRYGLANVGTKNKKVNLPSFLAMFVKHFINIFYFIQILGWNKVISYMKHEFFTVRNKRSFVGGHFSNRTPSFLLFPLRVWLGAVWLFEGIKKIGEDWLSTPKLAGFFGGANAWFDSILGSASTYATDAVTTATTATDAASSATGAVAEAVGSVFINWNILGLFKVILVSGKTFAESTLNDFAFKLDVPLINWFIDKVILSGDTMQIIAQVAIVIIEILIGLALIGGLFTFPSSAVSLVLQLMFVTTTGLYLGTFWMIFAGIAMLFGAGHVLGLDYYVMPFLKDKWAGTKLARKTYLYND